MAVFLVMAMMAVSPSDDSVFSAFSDCSVYSNDGVSIILLMAVFALLRNVANSQYLLQCGTLQDMMKVTN